MPEIADAHAERLDGEILSLLEQNLELGDIE